MQKSMRSVVLCMLAILLSANPPRASRAAEGLSSPFTLNMLKNATYKGFEEPIGPVGLNNGRWEGNPYVEGGASRPTVNLLEDLVLIGDLDGDGSNEAVVMLNESTGGTGQLLHLAVVARKEGKLDNVATTFVGDRIQIRAARIQDRRVILDVVRAGPQDAACCPGEVTSLGWVLALDGRLRPVSYNRKARKADP